MVSGKQLYEAWNRLWVANGAEPRPYERMAAEDPREACMWDDLAAAGLVGGPTEAALAAIERFARDNEGLLSLGFGAFHRERPDELSWSASLTFGREAEDSPMAGGQALGVGATLAEVLAQVIEQAKIEVPDAPEPITAEEAKNLLETFQGGRVDGALLDSVTPKLDAIVDAGRP